MPRLLLTLVFAGALCAQTSEETAVVAVAQKLFDAMAAKDGEAARAVGTADARHVAIRADGTFTVTSHDQFAGRLAASKGAWLERMWNPKVQVRGRIANVWAEYDFHRDGQFSHCGIDNFTMVKSAEGWKIAEIAYTVETVGCAPSPLGKP